MYSLRVYSSLSMKHTNTGQDVNGEMHKAQANTRYIASEK